LWFAKSFVENATLRFDDFPDTQPLQFRISHETSMLTDELIVIDFETTGLSPEQGDRITEVAAVRVSGNGIVDRYESLANCGVKVPTYITALTGINQRMVDKAPPVTQVMQELLGFVGDAPIVAHNASFDQRFFVTECSRAALSYQQDDFICSIRAARRVFPHFESYALGSLARQLGISFGGAAHRAAADAEVTANVVMRLAHELQSKHAHLSINALLLCRLLKMPVAASFERLQRLRQ
jgi:DNA polymerase III subunit epsilon